MQQKEGVLDENLKKLNSEMKKTAKEKKEVEDKSSQLRHEIEEVRKTAQQNTVRSPSLLI